MKTYYLGDWVMCRGQICRIINYGDDLDTFILSVNNDDKIIIKAFKEEIKEKVKQ